VVWALYKAAKELWKALTLPRVVLAGPNARGGAWLLNHFDPSSMRIPTAFNRR